MKLNKKKLIEKTNKRLKELGYYLLTDSITGADGLFIKVLRDGFFLSLGFTISKFYESRFTASYYLSKSTRWSSIWGDIPKESYVRIGKFLVGNERNVYLNDEYNKHGITDAWWDGTEDGISNFLETIAKTEERFLSQSDLFDKIEKSTEVKVFVKQASMVFSLLTDKKQDLFSYHYLPEKITDGIPIEVYKASERVLVMEKSDINNNIVTALAGDVWRQMQLKAFFPPIHKN